MGERRHAQRGGGTPARSPAPGCEACRAQLHPASQSLGRVARHLAGAHARRAPRRARQHLESLPVHGHVPARAQRVAVRDRPRPRHRLSRLEPGLPRRRAHGAGRGAHAAHAPRGHAEERRQRLSPVPAIDAHRQCRNRRRLQRRPAVARARRRCLRARNRPRRPARCDRAVRGRAGRRRHDARPPRGVARLHAGAARGTRAAADRPRRLERLPQPECALDRSGRVVPDRTDAHQRPRGIGDDRRAVRAGGTRVRHARRSARRMARRP